MDNEDIRNAKEWFRFAQTDYGVAEHLFGNYHPKPLEIICFHCQQAVEKCLKAIIVLYGSQGGMPKKHDLFLLLNQIKNMVKFEQNFYDYADILSPYSVAMRYPNELHLEERHSEEALRIAKEVMEWTDGILERNGSEK